MLDIAKIAEEVRALLYSDRREWKNLDAETQKEWVDLFTTYERRRTAWMRPPRRCLDGLIIGLDFDGTCVAHDYPEIGHDIGAPPVLRALAAAGAKLVLNTMRCDDGDKKHLSHAVEWFRQHNIPLHGVAETPGQREWTLSTKVYAQVYIDDAALGAPLIHPRNKRSYIDWSAIAEIFGVTPQEQ